MSAQFICGTNPSPSEVSEINDMYDQIILNGHHHQSQNGIVRIPIAIHFGGGITDEDLCCLIKLSEEQIKVLNRDFGATNGLTLYNEWHSACPASFPIEALSTGSDIEFYIATTNHPPQSGLIEGEYALTIGEESWESQNPTWSDYLNIYVDDNLSGGVFGETKVGGVQMSDVNGVRIRNTVFGAPNTACVSGIPLNTENGLKLGRILTHEVGHYLGLFHVYQGEDCADPVGDDIDDTPKQDEANFGEPTAIFANCMSDPSNASSAYHCGSLDFYMNFMDNTDDDYRVMFTTKQTERLEAFASATSWPDKDELSVCTSYESPQFSLDFQEVSCSDLPVNLNAVSLINERPCHTIVRWSTDGDPSNGIDDIIDTPVEEFGLYYAYFYNTRLDCYGPASAQYEIRAERKDMINGYKEYDANEEISGGIEVLAGGEAVIRGIISLGSNSEIIIRDGGSLHIVDDGAISPCFDEEGFWKGVTVHGGGTFEASDNATLFNSINGITAMNGSSINIEKIYIINIGIRGNTALSIDGSVNLSQAKNINIDNFDIGIKATNGHSYYYVKEAIITDVGNGIIAENSPCRIFECGISAKNNGIELIRSGGSTIEECTILTGISNPEPEGTFGIYLRSSPASSIWSNTIGSDAHPAYHGIVSRFSLGCVIEHQNNITSSNLGVLALHGNVRISQNEIKCQPGSRGGIITALGRYGDFRHIKNNIIDASGSEFGIENIWCADYKIENNEIFGELTNLERVGAVRLMGCRNQTVGANDIHDIGSAMGMYAQNSTGNTFECNEVTGGSEGLGVFYNSFGQTIRGNTINSSVDLAIRSVTGLQVHQGNKFIGGNVDASMLSASQVDESRFFVNPNFQYFNPTNPNPPSNWFIPQTNVIEHFDCVGEVGPNWKPFWDDEELFCQFYHNIVNEYGIDSYEYTRMVLALERYYLDQEEAQHFDCMDETSVQSCIQSLVDIEGRVMRLFDVEIASLINEVTALHEMQDGEGDPSDMSEAILKINLLNEQFATDEQNASIALNDLWSELQELNCSNNSLFETNRNILLDVISYLQTDTPENFDFSKSIHYSQFCSDDYGAPIHLARFIASHATKEYFDVNDDCRSNSNEFRLAEEEKKRTLVFPNPSTGLVNLQFDQEINGTIKVYNSQGYVLEEQVLNDKLEAFLDMSESIGLHFIEVTRENGESELIKTLILK